MQPTAKYGTALNLLFLAIIVVAYTGKALHRHGDEYYADFERTECTASGQSSIADDCRICHFNFFPCLYAAITVFALATVLLVRYIGVPTPKRIEKPHYRRSLRAPPVESSANM